MNRLGEVVSTAQGLLILRPPAATEIEIGTTTLDESLDTVGRVVDVFGPVEQPYVAVTPDDGNPDVFLGVKLYTR
ncbi:MAG: Gar1/Naf1 family protein [Halobacteriales archaeon]|nr:Gar1/Naf1 family protein [Halobacteriales archaeon]